MMQILKGDIVYYLKFINLDIYYKYEEGFVVGFFFDEEGEVMIYFLISENVLQVVMVGVISRLVYLEVYVLLENDIIGQ